MPGLVPGIHAFLCCKTWMAGTSPAMTSRLEFPKNYPLANHTADVSASDRWRLWRIGYSRTRNFRIRLDYKTSGFFGLF
jgi:hypothetical protein